MPPLSRVRETPAILEAKGRAWLDEHREAIEHYNALVAKRGLFGDGRRRF